MEKKLDDLVMRFQTKGFKAGEIPGLINDVIYILGNSGDCTISAVNQEMEELGWGIEIMDNVTYGLANDLVP